MLFYQSASGGVQEGAFDVEMWTNKMSILREINDLTQTAGHDDSDNVEVCWNHLD